MAMPSSRRSGFPRRKHEHVYSLRSEEHTSELQSLTNLVCRLLLEKKKDDDGSVVVDLDRTPPRATTGRDSGGSPSSQHGAAKTGARAREWLAAVHAHALAVTPDAHRARRLRTG